MAICADFLLFKHHLLVSNDGLVAIRAWLTANTVEIALINILNDIGIEQC